MINHEKNLIEQAAKNLFNNTGIKIDVLEYEPVIEDNRRADGLVQLDYNALKKKYYVEAKRWLTTQTVLNVVNQVKEFPKKGMIVTEYANPNIAEKLKEMNIPFIDLAGNAYINEPPIYIFIKGNKTETTTQKKEKKTRAFQQTGLKVIFAFLCDEELINATYREISKATNVAVGTVGWVIHGLKREGFLINIAKKERRLYQKEKLFEKWVEAYNRELRPKIRIGIYKTGKEKFWKNLDIEKYDALWGGEVAGKFYTNYLRPEIVTVYIKDQKQNLNKFLIDNRLKENENGNVEIYEYFWEYKLKNNQKTEVHPIIAYADLIATGNPRNIETAKIIYEKEIHRYIQQN